MIHFSSTKYSFVLNKTKNYESKIEISKNLIKQKLKKQRVP
eukprot:UN19275